MWELVQLLVNNYMNFNDICHRLFKEMSQRQQLTRRNTPLQNKEYWLLYELRTAVKASNCKIMAWITRLCHLAHSN